ncbi:hypothetical protein [Methanocalculus sp.]|uniref:hypothetical protein n=1 Tax=Methanocalculus sp. TaxID=2004547 RepID=UPI0025E2D940|nr:hypothetical protein [Methanocalculus sp.]
MSGRISYASRERFFKFSAECEVMDIPMLRTWVIFYLLSFVVLLFALFLSTQGVLLWVSLLLVILLIGVNLFTLSMEIKRRSMKKELLKTLSRNEEPEFPLDQKKLL